MDIVTREVWLSARLALLEQEKALTRAREQLAVARRALPWVAVEKQYSFDSERGRVSLADLFDGKSQLIAYHFMFDPQWDEGCSSCSFFADNFSGAIAHIAQRDVSMVFVSRAPLAKIAPFKKRMGWTFPWVSSFGTDFNHDFHVSARGDEKRVDGYNYGTTEFNNTEAPGVSVFARDGERIFHTYSTFSRGLDTLSGAYQLLDLAPKGRDEVGLNHPQDWIDYRDRYSPIVKLGR